MLGLTIASCKAQSLRKIGRWHGGTSPQKENVRASGYRPTSQDDKYIHQSKNNEFVLGLAPYSFKHRKLP